MIFFICITTQVLKIESPRFFIPDFNKSLFDNPLRYGDQISIFFRNFELIPSISPSLNALSSFFANFGRQSG